MEAKAKARTSRQPARSSRTPRGRGPPPPSRTAGQNPRPSHCPPSPAAMEDDAITTLMDIDDSPRSPAGLGFLDEDDDGEMLNSHRVGGRGNEARGPLPFAGFFNAFDGADFDDDNLA